MAAGFKSVTTVGNPQFPGLFALPGLVVLDHQGDVTIHLQNCTDSDMELPRNTIIGSIENLSHPDFREIQPIDQAKVLDHVSGKPDPAPTPLTGEAAKEFLSKANLKVPACELAAYQDILLKNYDVFSTDKNETCYKF